jgi:hypothetical protein
VRVGDLVKNKSALGQARGALGLVLSVDQHHPGSLGSVVVAWINGTSRNKYPMFLLEKV